MIVRDEVYAAGSLVAADVWDLDATPPTYRREESGVVVASRPMTADEIAAKTPTPVGPTLEERTAAAAAVLEQAAVLPAPYVVADLAELMAEAARALRGEI